MHSHAGAWERGLAFAHEGLISVAGTGFYRALCDGQQMQGGHDKTYTAVYKK
jgi:hypothetical protein